MPKGDAQKPKTKGRSEGCKTESTLKYAEHKLDEAIRQGETDVDIAYWRGYRDCAKAMMQDHFPDLTKMVPLTPEQLREMDGPVWNFCKPLEGGNGYWCLCKKGNIITPGGCVYSINVIPNWVFYAYPPARIDRKSWGLCEFCRKADFGEYGFEIGRSYVKIACALGSWRFPVEEQFRFCPKCGRPLTEEAWTELEKRLSGVNP